MYILLFGVLTFSGMAVFANKVGFQAQLRGAAVSLATNQLAVLETTSFSNLTDTTGTAFAIPAEWISQLPGGSNGKTQITGNYQVETLSNTKKKVSVQIKWRNAASPESNVVKPWSQVRIAALVVKPGSVTAN